MQVKDQMVWMMLEERSKLHEEKRALQEQVESLQQDVQAKDRKIEALEVSLLVSFRACALCSVPGASVRFAEDAAGTDLATAAPSALACSVVRTGTCVRRRGVSSPDGWMDAVPTERRPGRGGELEAAV